jgi:hypothetical protein
MDRPSAFDQAFMSEIVFEIKNKIAFERGRGRACLI